RVEEVQAEDALGLGAGGGDRRDGERGGVRGEPCAGRGGRGAGEEVALQRQVLGRRLDHPGGAGGRAQLGGGGQARQERLRVLAEAALLAQAGEHVGQPRSGPLQG